VDRDPRPAGMPPRPTPPDESKGARPDHLVLGHVAQSHGVHGEVKVAWYPDQWEPFQAIATVWLGTSAGPPQPFQVERARSQGRAVLLKLAGIETPEAAARLVGREVAIPRGGAPPPPEGTYYHYDILGLAVMEGERLLGTVREILETPAHDVYVVDGVGGEWLLPATRAHIRRVDPAAGVIEIEPWGDLVPPSSGGDETPEAI
jgi:16S rRNA processing protein RimM